MVKFTTIFKNTGTKIRKRRLGIKKKQKNRLFNCIYLIDALHLLAQEKKSMYRFLIFIGQNIKQRYNYKI